MEELNRALETTLTAAKNLSELTKKHKQTTKQDFTGEGLFNVKAKCLAKYSAFMNFGPALKFGNF